MSNLTVGINRTHLQQQHDTSETVNQFLTDAHSLSNEVIHTSITVNNGFQCFIQVFFLCQKNISDRNAVSLAASVFSVHMVKIWKIINLKKV